MERRSVRERSHSLYDPCHYFCIGIFSLTLCFFYNKKSTPALNALAAVEGLRKVFSFSFFCNLQNACRVKSPVCIYFLFNQLPAFLTTTTIPVLEKNNTYNV